MIRTQSKNFPAKLVFVQFKFSCGLRLVSGLSKNKEAHHSQVKYIMYNYDETYKGVQYQ